MPNIVGIWDPGASTESIQARLKRQLRRVRVPNINYQEYNVVHAGFGVALQDHGLLENGKQPFQARDSRTYLIMDGEIYNGHELKKKYRDEFDTETLSDGEMILELLIKYGTDIVNVLNGVFILVLFDPAESRLTLICDRYGFRPLFYVQRGRSLIFGSELKSLCAIDPEPRRLDELGTLELFCYRSQIADRSWLNGYIRLPPAAILTLDKTSIHRTLYWRYQYDEGAAHLDQETYFSLFGTLLDRAVERHMKGSHRIGLFLSGGYDSRSIAASIRNYHHPVTAFTFGDLQSRDVRYATLLAQRLDLDHVKFSDNEPYLTRFCRVIVWRTEGMLPFAHTASIRYHHQIKDKADIILVGLYGEVCGAHFWPQLLMARSRSAMMRTIFKRLVGARIGSVRLLFNPVFFKAMFGELRRRFDQSFEDVENEHPLNIADSWSYTNLAATTAFHAPSVDRHLLEVRAPLLDHDLTNFLLAIHPLARLEQRVYKKMIFHQFPQIRDLPCTNSGRPVNPNFCTEYASMVLNYAGRKLSTPVQNLLGLERGLGRNPRDMNAAFRAEPELFNEILKPLINAGVFVEEIFNISGIEQIFSRHYENKANDWEMLSLIISLGLAVKYFLHDDFADVPESMLAP